MKILALASILSSIIICPPTEARSVQASQHEVLRNVQINGEKTGYIALLNLDFLKHTINIEIVRDICGQYADTPPGTIRCMAMATTVEEITVPMSKALRDGCGSSLYQGQQNDMPVDGTFKKINVTDNNGRICENVIESLIVVDAKVISPRPRAETNYHITK